MNMPAKPSTESSPEVPRLTQGQRWVAYGLTAALTLLTAYYGWKGWTLSAHGQHIQATVVSLGSKGRATASFRVRQQEYETNVSRSLSRGPLSRGDSVDVLYDPDDPSTSSEASLFDLWALPVVLAGGLVVTVGGLARVALRGA